MRLADVFAPLPYRREREPNLTPGWVYFVRCPALGAIKAGFTTQNPLARLVDLQTGCPLQLDLVGAQWSEAWWERQIHLMWSRWHLRGEWFTESERITAFVERELARADDEGRLAA